MVEWLLSNWQGLLGTGGVGVIIVAFIANRSKNTSNPTVLQKIKAGDNSASYQSGRDMTIGTDKVGDKDV